MSRSPQKAIPRCESCPSIGRPCPACRNARRRERYVEERGGLVRSARPRCASCPPVGKLCPACQSAYEAERHKRRMQDPAYAERKRASAAKADAKRREMERANGVSRKRGYIKTGGPIGRKPTRPRCADCPPVGEPCKSCFNAHRAKLKAARAPSANVRLSAALSAAEAIAARRAASIRPGYKPMPRCADCPPVGKPCKDCYNAYKRAQKGGDGTRQAPTMRERPSATQKPPARRLSDKCQLAAEVTAQRIVEQAGRRDRNWDLDTCCVCMRKGRWGVATCPRCAEKVAPPPGWTASQKATSYTAEDNARKRSVSA